MTEWIKSIVTGFSYPGIVFLMFIENVFPPIPSELIMPLAGYVSSQGQVSFVGVVIAGAFGSVLGALPLYWIGRRVGEERFSRWTERHGHWIGLTPDDLKKSKSWFEKHGVKTVLLCRLVPGIRSLISIPAGFAKMPMGTFLLLTTIGSAAWSFALAYAGRALGAKYEQVEHVVGPVSTTIVVGLLLLFLFRAVRQHLKKRRHA
jgi:membrane protein DedA with SNARE-associated domain